MEYKKGVIDEINAKRLRNMAIYITDALELILNKCMEEEGMWPTTLKIQEVIPILIKQCFQG